MISIIYLIINNCVDGFLLRYILFMGVDKLLLKSKLINVNNLLNNNSLQLVSRSELLPGGIIIIY